MTDEIRDLSGAYALNAVTDDERAAVERAMLDSETFRTEITELSDTAVVLGSAISDEQPPASLKASLMAMLDETPQLPAPTETAGDRERSETAPTTDASSTAFAATAGPAERKASARWFARPVALVGMAAAAVLVVVGGVTVANVVQQPTTSYSADAEQFAAINAAEDAQRISADVSGGGNATLVWSEQLASSAMIVDGLEQLPEESVYELWYIDGDGARPAGLFDVEDDGGTWRVLDGDMRPGDTIGITVEPEGGSDAPTTDPIVAIASA